MNTYTRAALPALLGIDENSFATALIRYPTKSGQIFKLNEPIDTGERSKAKYVALMDRKGGWALFPSLASARLWNRDSNWVANVVTATL